MNKGSRALREGSVAVILLVSSISHADAQIVRHIHAGAFVGPGPFLSGNGRFVLYNESPNGCSSTTAAFVYDRTTLTSECVSVSGSGAVANDSAIGESISADGRFVTLRSRATNLDPNCASGTAEQVFVRDRRLRTTRCVSYTDAAGEANLGALNAIVSADGSAVAFSSPSTNLIASDRNGTSDVFVWAAASGTIARRSHPGLDSAGNPSTEESNGPSIACAIDADGTSVLYASTATNLFPGPANGLSNLFVSAGADTWIVTADADEGVECAGSAISSTGSFVSFVSGATGLVEDDTNGVPDVFVHQLSGVTRVPGTTRRVSVDENRNQADGPSGGSSISADGSFVAYTSLASNLVSDDTNGRWDVFVTDLRPAARYRFPGTPYRTRRVSVSRRGAEGQDDSGGPTALRPDATTLSADGRFVVFFSAADVDGWGPGLKVARNSAGPSWVVTSATTAGRTLLRGFDAGGIEILSFAPPQEPVFESSRVVMGDVTGDGAPELVTATGPGGASRVQVRWVGTGVDADPLIGAAALADFRPYHEAFTGGVFVATGDLDGDGKAEIITGADAGGGPHVRVFRVHGFSGIVTELFGFFAYQPTFSGGVRVAAGDVDGDGRDELITAAGPGGGPHVRVFKWNATTQTVSELSGFMAYARQFTGGVFVAAGDIDGNGKAEIITGAGEGGGPHVRAFTSLAPSIFVERVGFMAYPLEFRGGVRVAAVDWDGNGEADIVTGAGPGGGPHVRVISSLHLLFGGTITPHADFFVTYDQTLTSGVFVAGVQP